MHQLSQLKITAALLLISASCASPPPISSNPIPSAIPILPRPTHSAATPATPKDIWVQMRQGKGYVVLLRHALTVPGTGDPPEFRLNDCTTQRNLSTLGREQALQIGKAFRDRNIPIRQVLSSQYCRCLDTAKLLNLGTVKPFPSLNSIFVDRTSANRQTQQVRQQILSHRNTSGVIVMVSHFVNINAISGIGPQSGEAVVVRTNQQGTIEVIGQIQNL